MSQGEVMGYEERGGQEIHKDGPRKARWGRGQDVNGSRALLIESHG